MARPGGFARLARLAAQAAIAASVLASAACAEGVAGPDAPADTTGNMQSARAEAATTVATPGALAFTACSGTYASYTGSCATLRVPLDWAQPDGRTIPVLVNRLVASTAPAASRRSLWLLQGGPGGTAAGLEEVARGISALVPDLDIFALEHRGVGGSAGLACPHDSSESTPSAFTACADALTAAWDPAGLAAFNTTNAAKDLVAAIDAAQRNGTRAPRAKDGVFVYGVSYGTYWAHRYLQVAPPGQAAGVLLDSILPPRGQYVSGYDAQFDPQAKKLAELCAADATCRTYLGNDPWSRLQVIRQHIAEGTCPNTFDGANRRVLSVLLESWSGRPYALAAMARYERCAPEDVLALQTLIKVLDRHAAVGDGVASKPLAYNVLFSELYESPAPSAATMDARYAAAVFPAGVVELSRGQSEWPLYPADEHVGAWAKTTTPMLMMNGTLDCQTPIESAAQMRDAFHGPHQTFIAIPNANHVVLTQSPVLTPGAPACGMQIAASFLRDPLAAPDTSCLSDLAPVTFAGDAAEASRFFGVDDAWAIAAPGQTASR
jgi:pimeloyl-ACP methyl ester carboxylesterase